MNATVLPRRAFQFKALIFFTLFTLGVGLLGGLIGGTSQFTELEKPPLTCSATAFPFIWTFLYIIIGVAAYLVWNANDIDGGRVLRLYFVQLLLNFLWPLIFLRFQWRLFAFFWMLILIAIVSLVLTGFKYIRKFAYWLTIPYFFWLLYLAYLNLGFYLLNRQI
ncbi:MAG: tryptophan-rich sensory protein [Oscillospiraceae bacterium]|nr:tryptophan-rich sensory protein [Oscillospiraceae bacterium]MDD4413379.1 tryptophan-rich sensory protein [Oscillospiraceae bacterium]